MLGGLGIELLFWVIAGKSVSFAKQVFVARLGQGLEGGQFISSAENKDGTCKGKVRCHPYGGKPSEWENSQPAGPAPSVATWKPILSATRHGAESSISLPIVIMTSPAHVK